MPNPCLQYRPGCEIRINKITFQHGSKDERLLNDDHCNATWDGLMCWSSTPAGQTAEQKCPAYVDNFYRHATATRKCLDSGQWFFNSELNATWSNYTSCKITDSYGAGPPLVLVPKEHMERIKLMYSIGYGVSLFALSVAIFIMIYFKRLRCPRNTLHLHLFTAFVLRALLSFLKDSLLVRHLGLPHDV
ncbi:parathyroid hormone 2 receptor-like, partial [Aplysia californica]|uniref:Parathyroid hormone 2 receptor-like n=1 Tax=Aplysia californica TaxID=6500 RepID=A0ABM1W3B7_APLCA